MQELLNFFAGFGDFLVSCGEFISGFIEDLIDLVLLLRTAAAQLPQLLSFLPEPFVVLLGIFLTAAILYKFLGREG